LAARLARLPLWSFHGDLDKAVPVSRSRDMIKAILLAGGTARYTEYAGVGHNSWDKAYAEPALYDCSRKQRATDVDRNQAPMRNDTSGFGSGRFLGAVRGLLLLAGVLPACTSALAAPEPLLRELRVLSAEWVCGVVDPTGEILQQRDRIFAEALEKDRAEQKGVVSGKVSALSDASGSKHPAPGAFCGP
jgi:hypothetical protein